MLNHMERKLGIVGNVGDGEVLEGWRRSSLVLGSRANSTAGWSDENELFDKKVFELFDKHRPTGQAQVRVGSAALAGRHKAAIHDHASEQVESVRTRPSRGHRQRQSG